MKTLLIILLFTVVGFSQQLKFTGNKIKINSGQVFSGVFMEATAGDTLYHGQLAFLDTDNKFYLVYPDSINHFESKLAIVADSVINLNKIGRFLIEGFIEDTSWAYTSGDAFWADTGGVIADYASVDTKVDKDVGFAVTPDILYIDPNREGYYWDDLRFPISAVRLPGSGAPTATSYVGSQVLAFPTNADATIYFVAQMPHAWVEGTDLGVHIHYALDTDGSNPDSVRFVFTYSWADISEAIVEPTTDQTTINVSAQTDSLHYYQELLDITGTGKTLSSILLCSLTRDVSEDDYGGNVYLMEIDIHYQTDGKGSRLELVK